MSNGAKIIHTNCDAIAHGLITPTVKSQDEMDMDLAAQCIKRTARLNDNTIDMALRLKDARDFIAWSACHLRGSWLDWEQEATKAAKEITMIRMTFDRESKTAIAAGKDVITLFNSPEYLKAHATMKEMVDMLDRFSQLKRDGTMDAFADFILKVSCK